MCNKVTVIHNNGTIINIMLTNNQQIFKKCTFSHHSSLSLGCIPFY